MSEPDHPAPVLPRLPDPAPLVAWSPTEPPGRLAPINVVDRALIDAGPPRPLLPHSVYRRVLVGSSLIALALFLALATGQETTGPAFAAAFLVLCLLSCLALPMWSAVASINAGRARSSNRHLELPGPVNAALSWFTPVAAVVLFVAVANGIGAVVEDPFGGQPRGSVVVRMAVMSVAVVLMLMSLYRPYGVLRKVAAWVAADSGRFVTWFFSPFVGAVIVAVAAGLIRLLQLNTGPAPDAVVTAIVIVLMSLPSLLWLWVGNRALTGVEASIEHQHARACEAHRDAVRRLEVS